MQAFVNDKKLRDEVLAYLNEYINQDTLHRVRTRQDVSHVYETVMLITAAFDALEQKPMVQPKQVKNEAR